MPVQLLESHPNVQENSGRVAVKRRPIVYCLEVVDNGNNLRDISIDINEDFIVREESPFNLPVLHTEGYRRDPECYKSLYNVVSDTTETKTKLKFIPYSNFANRGISEMIVWILKH